MELLLTNLTVGNRVQNGVLYCKSFSTKPKKTGGVWGTGFFVDKAKNSMLFKVWDAPLINQLQQLQAQGKVLEIDFDVVTYEGNNEIKVTAVRGIAEGVNASEYQPSADVEGNKAQFNAFVNENMSKNYIKFLTMVMQQPLTADNPNETVFSRFKVEYAATTHHDLSLIHI